MVVVLLAVSLSVALAVGHYRSKTDDTAPPLMNTTTGSNSSGVKNGVLNNTAFAAVTTADNSRHVYFQDINGTIPHAALLPGSNTWTFKKDYLIPHSSPRIHTSLAAMSYSSSVISGKVICLFYVTLDNLLAIMTLEPDGQLLDSGWCL